MAHGVWANAGKIAASKFFCSFEAVQCHVEKNQTACQACAAQIYLCTMNKREAVTAVLHTAFPNHRDLNLATI